MKGFDNATGRAGKRARMSDYADMVTWPEKDYKQYRMIGPLYSVCNFWFTIATQRKPDGQSIPMMCLDHDGNTDKFVSDVCPFRKSGLGRESREYYINVIDREEQEGRDYRPLRGDKEEHMEYLAHWLRAGDYRKTPVRLLAIPDSQIDKIKAMKKLNKVRDADGTVRQVDISDRKYGCDISIMYDPDKKGPAKYDVQKGDRKPITREENDYGLYRADLLQPMRLEEAKREMADLMERIVRKDDKRKRDGGGSRRSREPDDPLMDETTTRLNREDLEDDDRGSRRSRRDRDDPDDELNERRGRRSRDDDQADGLDEDFDQSTRRSRSRDDDDRPRGRPRSGYDEDDDRASRRSRSQDDDDDRASRRSSRDDDDRGSRRPRSRDRDDDDRPSRSRYDDDDRSSRRRRDDDDLEVPF